MARLYIASAQSSGEFLFAFIDSGKYASGIAVPRQMSSFVTTLRVKGVQVVERKTHA